MPGDYPLPSSDPASLGFAAKPLDHLDRLIKQHIEEGRYPGAQIALARHGQLALFRTYGNAKTEPSKVPATNDTPVPAVQPDQGADQFGGVDAGGGRQAVLHGQDRRSPAGVRRARQGRHHAAAGDDASGRLPVEQRDQGDVDRSRADARRGVRLRAGLDARLEAAIPRPGGASGAGDGDRGGHRPGLSRRDPRQGDRAARTRQRHLRRRAGSSSSHAAPTPMRRSRATTPPSSARRVCRAAAASRRRAAWRRSIRCCWARDGSAMCGCSRRG